MMNGGAGESSNELNDCAVVCTAADSGYFPLLAGLVQSLKAGPFSRRLALGVFDLGLDDGQKAWLAGHDAMIVEPGWDVDFPYRSQAPSTYRAMSARPYLPKYFPGHDLYLWIDADAWVQDDTALPYFLRAAAAGKLAIVAELDRGYWTTTNKRPRLWGQNQRAFAWSFGMSAGYRLGRHPILNVGLFALAANAPFWALWAEAHRHSLVRRRLGGSYIDNFNFFLSEQTALNYVVFGQKQPFTLLPATANWLCGKGTPKWDAETARVVEPHEPYTPLSVVHLAGKGMKERVWSLETLGGGQINCRLTYEDVMALRNASPVTHS